MEFGIEKCAMLIMRSGKRQIMERIELSDQERIKMLGEKNIGSEWHQTAKDKRKKEYLKGSRKLPKIKLCNGNLIKEINTSNVPLEIDERKTQTN